MIEVVVSYHSGNGHTRRLVDVLGAELERLGAQVHIADVEALGAGDWEAMRGADAHVFAAPTYMGSVSAPYKAFMDASSDIWGGPDSWQNKIAAGMTVATYPSGDKQSSLMQMAVFAAQHGMVWVGLDDIGAPVDPDKAGINEDGYCLGLGACSVRDKTEMIRAGDVTTARRFAERLYEATARWRRGA
ncbi:flavodoxin family protein [Lentibacter sp. XHP0401]|jgi:NAD(P)H dehydrogenase (quinone)|uniref:flavodoxin family protein n=1 Tax=Lentibacter sp. XHP0401 TaxID=2984334 RepID=UPI0021E71FEE|nr:flavodoxin family protein [Lentibacter sp. XHP0401]MCV2893753.1 flavodoxin family protein [Lentibacter sp. XHP0401]